MHNKAVKLTNNVNLQVDPSLQKLIKQLAKGGIITFIGRIAEGYVVLTRGLKCNNRVRKTTNNFGKGKETLLIHRKAFLMEDVKPFINSTDIKEILRNINTNGNHLRNLHMFFESLTSILPLGRGFMAQPTYWDLRDRGTYSFRGFIAYKPWSLCPSLFYMGFNNTFMRNIN